MVVRTAAMMVDHLDASKAHELVSLSADQLGVKKVFQLVEQMAG